MAIDLTIQHTGYDEPTFFLINQGKNIDETYCVSTKSSFPVYSIDYDLAKIQYACGNEEEHIFA